MTACGKQILHFVFGEAEAVRVVAVEHGPDLGIVQTGKNSFLGDAQDAGDHAEAAMLAVLHRAGEKVAEELQRLLAEAVRRGVVDGRIVLVNQDDRAFLIVSMERGCQNSKARLNVRRNLSPVKDVLEQRSRVFIARRRFKDRPVALVFDADGHTDSPQRISPRSALRVLERDEDHRVLALFGAVLGILPDLRSLEKMRVALLRLLEERLEHPHRECLAEAARTGKDRDRGLLVEKPRYELRLVGRPVAGLDLGPVAVADRQCGQFRLFVSCHFLHVANYTKKMPRHVAKYDMRILTAFGCCPAPRDRRQAPSPGHWPADRQSARDARSPDSDRPTRMNRARHP